MNNDNGSLYYSASLNIEELKRGADQSKKLLQSIGSTAEQEGNAIDASFKKIGAAAAGIFAVSQIKDFVTNVARVRGEFQNLEVSFTTMLGSADKASALMDQLVETAAKTPFGLQDVANGAKQLLAYGLEADKVNETLIRLGDIASGLSIPLNDLTYLYGTTMVQGRMYTQDLNQFLGRGIPIMEELAEQFGVGKEQVKDLVTAGKVGFPEVEKAIISLTEEGSKFGGLMEERSKTIAGQMDNIEDSIQQMFNEIGKESEGVINTAISAVSTVVENWKSIGKAILVVVAAYGTYKAAVLAVAAAHKLAAIWGQVQAFLSLTKSVTSAKDAMLLLNMATKANPVGLVLSVVAAAATAMWAFSKSTSSAAGESKALAEATRQYNEETAKEQLKIDTLFKKLRSAKKGTEEYKTAKEQILSQYGEYLKGMDKEIASLDNVEGAYKAVAAAARDAAKARAMEKVVTEAADTYVKETVDAEEVAKKTLEKKYGSTKAANGELLSTVKLRELKTAIANGQKISEDFIKSFEEERTFTMQSTAGAYTTTTTVNDMRAAVKQMQGAKRDYETTVKDAEETLGALVGEKTNTKKNSSTTTTTSKTSGKTKSGKSASDLQAEVAERNREIQKYGEDVKAQQAATELEIRQQQISLMQDGADKELQQVQLNYDRLTAENEKRAAEMREALKDTMVLEWRNKNPKATDAQAKAYRDTLNVTNADLAPEQQYALKEYSKIAEQTRIKGNQDALTKMLEDVQTYEQQRAAVEEEYAQKRNALYEKNTNGNVVNGADGKPKLRAGVTQGNVDELNLKENDALAAIDEAFAERSAEYVAWCDAIGNMTLEQLEKLLVEAQAALDSTARSEKKDERALAQARAKVKKVTDQLTTARAKEKQSDNADDKKKTIEKWKNLYEVLGQCSSEFEKIGDTIGGVAGEIISEVGGISNSVLGMVNGIVTLVTASSSSMQASAQTGSSAIKKLERASVILTIISAALQIATKIASLFNSDNDKQEEIEALQTRIDQLQWELDHAEAIRLQQNTGDVLSRIEAITQAAKAAYAQLHPLTDEMFPDPMGTGVSQQHAKDIEWMIELLEKASQRYNVNVQYTLKNTDILRASVEALAESYRNLKYTADKALGDAKYEDLNKQLENYAEQQIEVYRQLQEEKSKSSKKRDDDKISEYEQKLQELAEDAATVLNDALEEVIGGSVQDIAEELSDAMIEAFQNGEDAAEAWGDKVNEIVADIIKRMLVQSFLEERLGDVFDYYKAKWFKDGKFIGAEGVRDSMSEFSATLKGIGSEYQAIYEALPDDIKQMLLQVGEQEREAETTGIANASQESVDELNGRATAIQGHTYSINEQTKLLVANTNAILNSVLRIEDHTSSIASRMSNVETDLHNMRSQVDDIATRGVKVK